MAERFPVVVGAKATLAVQLADAARVDKQVFVSILKSPGLAPVIAMLEMVMAAAPVLVRVTDFLPPTPPTATKAQLRLVGETLAGSVAATPVPVSVTDCGLLVALSMN